MLHPKISLLIFTVLLLPSCKKNTINANPVTPGNSLNDITIQTDKAVYSPGEKVTLILSKIPKDGRVRYRHLDQILKDEPILSAQWDWLPPPTDFKGYLVEIYRKSGNTEKTLGSIAVDVSSNNVYFPRNGFLSAYGDLDTKYMESVMNDLNRYHMNVVQFQDWEFKHHEPLAGTVDHPWDSWLDIANRKNMRSTVENYIKLAHGYNMKTLSYNLIYGALEDAAADGVKDEWYMYKDKNHQNKEVFALPKPPFKSDIFFTDPSNTSWQNYIGGKTKEAFEVYPFDGYQVDQVGNRNKYLYTYDGSLIDLPETFKPFLESMKQQMPDKMLVMNAVNQYGQENSISKSPVDFLYTEVWAPDEGYKDLARIIRDNDRWSDNRKKSVLCAYMNYNIAEKPGYFNTPGVLLTNAVIFSFGGAHLELGEHMLGKEYFPNDNLKMKDDLRKAMIGYYDFLTSYENLLRDGGEFNTVPVICTNGKMDVGQWPPKSGKVSVQAKKVGNRQVLHFINFANAAFLEWRDPNGTQTEPKEINSAALEITYPGAVSKVWVASPDVNFGIPQSIPFTQAGNTLKLSLPVLKYWDMVVIE